MSTENYGFVEENGVYSFESPEAAFEVKTLARQMLEGNNETGILEILRPSEPPVKRKDETSLEVNNTYDSAPEAVEKATAVLQGDESFRELEDWYDE